VVFIGGDARVNGTVKIFDYMFIVRHLAGNRNAFFE
jgi:hypothetical protein